MKMGVGIGLGNVLAPVDPGLTLLRTSAGSWYDAKDTHVRSQVVPSRITDTHRATRGSAAGATLITTDGSSRYVWLPGITGNYVATPDTAAIRPTTQLEVVFRVALDDWNSSTASQYAILGKRDFNGNQRSWQVQRNSTSLSLVVSADGVNETSVGITVPGGTFVNGTTYWVKVTWRANNGSGNMEATYYMAADSPTEPTSWTLLGSNTTSAAIAGLFANTAGITVGGINAGTAVGPAGRWFHVAARNTIGGSDVARMDLAAATPGQGTFVSATGETWTITQTTDTNDPVFLPHDGRHYVWKPAPLGNHIIVSSRPVLTALTSIEFAVRVSHVTMPASTPTIMGSRSSQQNMSLDASGKLRVAMYNTSAQWMGLAFSPTAIPTATLTGGTKVWLRARLTASTALCEYWFSTDDTDDADAVTTWTSLGSVTGALAGNPTADTDNTRVIGSASVGLDGVAARYYAARFMYNGVTTETWRASDIDTSADPDAGQSSHVSGGVTWTVARGSSGLKTAVVTRPVWLFDGVDDFVQLPSTDTPTFTPTTGKHTVIVAYRRHNVDASVYERLFSSESASNNGLHLFFELNSHTVRALVGGATTSTAVTAGTGTAGALEVVAAVVDTGTLRAYRFGTGLSSSVSITGVGTITHSQPRLGCVPYGTSSLSEPGVVLCRSLPGVALTASELDAVATTIRRGFYG